MCYVMQILHKSRRNPKPSLLTTFPWSLSRISGVFKTPLKDLMYVSFESKEFQNISPKTMVYCIIFYIDVFKNCAGFNRHTRVSYLKLFRWTNLLSKHAITSYGIFQTLIKSYNLPIKIFQGNDLNRPL